MDPEQYVDVPSDAESSEDGAHCTDSSDTDSSNSLDSTYSDSSSSNSTSGRIFELAQIGRSIVPLPRELCENAAVCNEFLSAETWNLLPPETRQNLMQYLPKFPENNANEQQKTVEMFFSNEMQRFGVAPLAAFQRNLEDGNYRPEIRRYKDSIKRSLRREQKFQCIERVSRMAKQILVSRERIMKTVNSEPPGGTGRRNKSVITLPEILEVNAVGKRAKKRYFDTIMSIRNMVGIDALHSDDENYPEGPPDKLSKEQIQYLGAPQDATSIPTNEIRIISTMTPAGYTFDPISGPGGITLLDDKHYRMMLSQHRKRRAEEPEHPELNVGDIKLSDLQTRTLHNSTTNYRQKAIKVEKPAPPTTNGTESPSIPPVKRILPFPKVKTEVPAFRIPTPPPLPTTPPLQQTPVIQQKPPLQIMATPPKQPKIEQHISPPPVSVSVAVSISPPELVPVSFSTAPSISLKSVGGLSEINSCAVSPSLPQQLFSQSSNSAPYSSYDEHFDDDEDVKPLLIPKMESIPVEEKPISVAPPLVSVPNKKLTPVVFQQATQLKSNTPQQIQNFKQVAAIKLPTHPIKQLINSQKQTNSSQSPLLRQVPTQQKQQQQQIKQNTLLQQSKTMQLTTPTPPLIQNQPTPMLSPLTSRVKLESNPMFHDPCNDLEQLDGPNHVSNLSPTTATTTMMTIGTTTPPSNHLSYYSGKVKAATFSDLEGIDMMRLPVDLDDNIAIMEDIKNTVDIDTLQTYKRPEMTQETHACFLSLIRDIFCSTPDHRMTMDDLRGGIATWLANPITALNDWYSLSDQWLNLLVSAIHFLAGEFVDQPEDFVPYLEFKTAINIYQWIGAGRDSDQHLTQLCTYWLSRRNEMGAKPPPPQQNSNKSDSGKSKCNSMDNEDFNQERPASPPPPRCPTAWVVTKASHAEIEDFREQERQRFDHPHLAFTYHMHGYESVVGPVKGIYTQIPSLNKARGHTSLTEDRPTFVTLLTLVRDATARLPNGEGTRADICELLKSSQYVHPDTQESVLQTIVSGALDRMHTEHDPCVRYDPKRKIWIYLHRNRSEEEFERLHLKFQGITKHKKQSNRKVKSKSPKVCTNSTLSCSSQSTSSLSTPPKSLVSTPLVVVSTPTTPTSSKVIQAPFVVVPAQMPALSTIQNNATPTLSSISSSPVPTLVATTPAVSLQQQQPQQQSPQVYQSVKPPQLTPPPLKQITPVKAVVKSTEILNKEKPIEVIEVDTSPIDTQSTPIFMAKTMTSNLIIDAKTQKAIGQKSVRVIQSQQMSQPSTTSIKVSTPSGIQTVHVSAGLNPPKQFSSILANSNQSVLANHRAQSPIVVGKKLLKPIHLNQSENPPALVQSSGAVSTQASQSYIIPISLANSSSVGQVHTTSSLVSTTHKLVKSTMGPNATVSVAAKQSLLQTNKVIRQIPPGKSLINPTVAATLQQQHKVLAVSSQVLQGRTTLIANKTLQQHRQQLPGKTLKACQISTVGGKQQIINFNPHNFVSMSTPTDSNTSTVSLNAHQIIQLQSSTATSVSLNTPTVMTMTSGGKMQTVVSTANLTPKQQQTLLNSIKQQQLKTSAILANQHQPSQQQQQTQHSSQTGQLIQKQSQLSTQLIQQQSTTSTGQIMQQQQQQTQQPTQTSLIIKQPQNIQQIQKQLQQQLAQRVSTSGQPSSTVVSTSATPKAGTSLLGSNVIVSSAGRVLKQTSLIQTQQIPGIRQSSNNNPLMAKVLTTSSGQIISLESLLQKQGITPGTALRVSGVKPGQTSLIQLSNSVGGNSQMPTQYAVVSQGRNIISVAASPGSAHRTMTTTMAGNTSTVTTTQGGLLKTATDNKLETAAPQQLQLRQSGQNIFVTNKGTLGQKVQIPNVSSQSILTNVSPQMISAKVLGVQHGIPGAKVRASTAAGIRMVNASNLNIAHIGGKPVIIASKPPTAAMGSGGPQHAGHHNVILQTSGQGGNNLMTIGGQTLKVHGTGMGQTVMLGNQMVKVHPALHQSVNSVTGQSSSNSGGSVTLMNAGGSMTTTTGKTVILGTNQTMKTGTGQQIMLNAAQLSGAGIKGTVKGNIPSTATVATVAGQQRVVLAVQGGGQILLPPGFQGGPINLKSLQGLKMIPIQSGKVSSGEDRQMFAQIISAPQIAPRPPNPGSGGVGGGGGGSNPPSGNMGGTTPATAGNET